MPAYLKYYPKFRSHIDPSSGEDCGGYDYPDLSKGKILKRNEHTYNKARSKLVILELDMTDIEVENIVNNEPKYLPEKLDKAGYDADVIRYVPIMERNKPYGL